MLSQGNRANSSGKHVETIIDCTLEILRGKGYMVASQYTMPHNELKCEPIHSETIRVDFMIRGILNYETGLIISSKRQEKSGSAREKLHYHIHHIIKKCLPHPTIFLMIGDEWTSKERMYALSQIDGTQLLKVYFGYDGDFLKWAESLPKCTDEQILKSNLGLPLFQLSFL